jgi:hypothetical protein
MLEPIEIDLVIELLAKILSLEQEPRKWVFNQLQDYDLMLELAPSGSAGALAENIVHLCERSGWTLDPPLMLVLVRALPETPPVTQIKRKLSNRPKGRDPFDARLLITRVPLLNRDSFRSAVRRLMPEYGKCILTINGPKKCGKSYTAEYVQHLSAHLSGRGGGFRIVRKTLEGGVGSTYTPDVLYGDIVARMERSPRDMPERQAPMAAWINSLTNYLFVEAAATGHRWWWVLDGFCAPDLNPDTRKLVQAIIRRVVEGEHAKRVRLILLDYPEQLPHDVRARAHDEALGAPSEIGEPDVREVFVELNDDEKLGLTDERITEITNRVMKDLPSADETRLEALRERINGEIDALVP